MKTLLKALLLLSLAALLLCACASASADSGPTIRLPSKIVVPQTTADITPDKMLVPYQLGVLRPAGKCLTFENDGLTYNLYYYEDENYSHMQVYANVTDLDGWRMYYDYIPAAPDDMTAGYYEGDSVYVSGQLSRDGDGVYENYSFIFSYDGGTGANGRLETVSYSTGSYLYQWNVPEDDGWYTYDKGEKVYADPGVDKNPDLIPMPQLAFTGETLKLCSASGAAVTAAFSDNTLYNINTWETGSIYLPANGFDGMTNVILLSLADGSPIAFSGVSWVSGDKNLDGLLMTRSYNGRHMLAFDNYNGVGTATFKLGAHSADGGYAETRFTVTVSELNSPDVPVQLLTSTSAAVNQPLVLNGLQVASNVDGYRLQYHCVLPNGSSSAAHAYKDADGERFTLATDKLGNQIFTAMEEGVYTGRLRVLAGVNLSRHFHFTIVVGTGDDVLFLPTGLTAIETEAFKGVAARKVIVPVGCRSIAAGAFADCPRLAELSVPNTCVLAEGAVPAGVTVTRR